MNRRSCGPCSECCTSLAVAEVPTPRDTPCPLLRASGGCSCYAQRPGSCRAFTCAWLEGSLPAHLRPDKTHVVPYVVRNLLVLHVRPEHRGAHRRGPFGKWLKTRDPRLPMMVTTGDDREYLGPATERSARGESVRIV